MNQSFTGWSNGADITFAYWCGTFLNSWSTRFINSRMATWCVFACGRDYAGWGDVIGRLAAQYPHLVALEIDDMTHDIAPAEHGIFTPHVLARMQANLHTHSPTVNLAGTVYFSEEGPIMERVPDLSLVGDTMLFYFRNEKQGAGPCMPAACKWGPGESTLPPKDQRQGGGLAGALYFVIT